MKSVLLSIKPKYCELIASGKKTVEIRKNRPKIDVPFKVYIYQTKGHWIYKILEWLKLYQGKVIGEFICDNIYKYEAEFTEDNECYQDIRLIWKDEDYDYNAEEEYRIITSNVRENPSDCILCGQSCLSFEEIKKYIGIGDKTFYAWHISNLVIYDKPKELSEFGLTRPPQSWCYVEEV